MQEVREMTLSEWQQRLREVQDSIKSHEDSRRRASSIIRVPEWIGWGTWEHHDGHYHFMYDGKYVNKA